VPISRPRPSLSPPDEQTFCANGALGDIMVKPFVLAWGDIMVTATSLPALPDPDSIKDESSASDALICTLAVVATANRELDTAPREDQPGELHGDLAMFHEHLKGLFKDLHELLPKIASFRADITGWSVTVGMSNTLTVNFTNKHTQVGPDSEIREQDINVSG
jgi:hypothetical protein